MHRVIRWLWNAVGGAAHCWSIIGFVHAWMSGDAVVFGPYLVTSALAMQTYAALAFGTGIFLTLWNRDAFMQWRERRRASSPDAKFRRLHLDISAEFHAIETDLQFPMRSPVQKFVARQKLVLALAELGISAPKATSNDEDEWYRFVAGLLPLAEHRRLDDARLLLAAVRKQ